MKVDYTQEMIFSFNGPNLCMLGEASDFIALGKVVLELTDSNVSKEITITTQSFVETVGDPCAVIFSSKKNADAWGIILPNNVILFELDPRKWERIFQFFALLSWDKTTYYLNNYEAGLADLELRQDCNFICSSEF